MTLICLSDVRNNRPFIRIPELLVPFGRGGKGKEEVWKQRGTFTSQFRRLKGLFYKNILSVLINCKSQGSSLSRAPRKKSKIEHMICVTCWTIQVLNSPHTMATWWTSALICLPLLTVIAIWVGGWVKYCPPLERPVLSVGWRSEDPADLVQYHKLHTKLDKPRGKLCQILQAHIRPCFASKLRRPLPSPPSQRLGTSWRAPPKPQQPREGTPPGGGGEGGVVGGKGLFAVLK